MRWLVGWLVVGLVGHALAQAPFQLVPQSAPIRPNLLRNGSFEQVQDGLPVGWRWEARNTDAAVQVVEGEAATGARCLKLTRSTPFAPGMEAILRYEGGVPVQPNAVYTLSLRYRVRGGAPGFIGGGKQRRVRLPLEDTQGQWRRASITFATASDESRFDLVIVLESPTQALYIDDVKLEEGREPSHFVPAETPDRPLISLAELPDTVYLNESSWRGAIEFYLPAPADEVRVEVRLGEERLQGQAKLPAGVVRAEFQFAEPPAREQVLQVRIESANMPTAEARRTLTFFTRREARERIETLRQSLPRWQAQLNALRQRRQDIAYPLARFTVLQKFVPTVQADLESGNLPRAFQKIEELDALAQQLTQMLEEGLNGKRRLPTVPRYVTSPLQIKGASLIADTVDPFTGNRARRPVFFVGIPYPNERGIALEELPTLGMCLTQIGLDRADAVSFLRRAGQVNVRVNLQAGHSAVRSLPPMVREAVLGVELPVLQVSAQRGEENIQGAWREWLKARHKTLLTLNARWQTSYRDWSEIPQPTEGAPFAEFCEFLHDWTAAQLRRQAEELKRALPGIPIHTRLSSWLFLSDQGQSEGLDPQKLIDFVGLNGCATQTAYQESPDSVFAWGWVYTMMAYDLLRSLRDVPLFNGENRLVSRSGALPPQMGRALVWESAIRGVSATLLGEEVLQHPALMDAVAQTALDLNRLAPYVVALQSQPPDLYLYHSPLDLVLQGADAVVARDNLYIAFTMLGVRVGFVTEQGVAARQLPSGNRRIVLPAVQYISDEALVALDAYRQRGGGLAALGEPILRFDRYGRPRTSRLPVQTLDRDATIDARVLHQKLTRFLDEWGISRPLRLLNETGQPVWGVAYRTAPYGDGFVASLCNYTPKPITVRLVNDKDQPIRAVNLFTGEQVRETLTLPPLEPVLLRWGSGD